MWTAAVLLSASLVGSSPPAAEPTVAVEIAFDWKAAGEAPGVQVPVELHRLDGEAEPVRLVADIPGVAVAEVPAGLWRIRALSPEVFVETLLEIDAPDPGEKAPLRFELTARQASRLTASLRLPAGSRGDKSELPSAAQLLFDGRSASVDVKGDAACTVSELLELECKAPRGLLDLQLQVADFAPIYRWDLAAEREAPLGKLVLRPGASISGWIVAPGDGVDLA
ncbi:MAG: hypothetical protein AAFX50_04495, partial [Acidobacteriota bacterium]